MYDIDTLTDEQMHKSGHKMLRLCLWLLSAVGLVVLGIGGLIAVWVSWSSNSIVGLEKTVAVVAERMDTYNNEVTALRGDLKDYVQNQYTKAQAEADKRLIWREFEIINKRIDGLE